jgi:hypothetical protein
MLLGDDDWACAGSEGFQVASEGPKAIAGALQALLTSYDGNRATPVGPQAWFGTLYLWLEYQTSDTAYEPIRDLLVRCVADNAPYNPNERMFGKSIPHRKIHSIRSAAHEIGIEGSRLRKALDHAGQLRSGHECLADHEVTFDASDAAALLNRLKTALTLTQVASRLDIDWRQAKQLVDANHLRAMSPQAMGATNPYFAPEDLDTLIKGLIEAAETVASPPSGACGIPLAARRAQCRLAEMVALVLSGSLRWIGRLPDDQSLASVLVDVAEVSSRLRRPELTGHTRREVEQTLGIPSRTVNALIEKGFLAVTVQRHPSVPRDVLVIAPEELDRFRANYAKPSEIATAFSLPFKGLREALAARGITPVLNKDEFHMEFYGRNDVGKRDID